MSGKIELLAPYLPYGLEVESRNEPALRFVMGGISKVGCYVTDGDRLRIIDEHVVPHLRPFSQIDKPVVLDGKRVIPALEIARLAVGNDDWRVTSKNKYAVIIKSSEQKIYFYSNWNIEVEDTDRHCVLNNYKIIQLLHRLHFAPPGLDEGEYIAIEEGI